MTHGGPWVALYEASEVRLLVLARVHSVGLQLYLRRVWRVSLVIAIDFQLFTLINDLANNRLNPYCYHCFFILTKDLKIDESSRRGANAV